MLFDVYHFMWNGWLAINVIEVKPLEMTANLA